MNYHNIIDFWFTECKPSDWFKRSDAFDAIIKERFGEIHQQAALGETYTWRTSIDGRLAEIILLDQFSRNLYRNSQRAYAQDAQALALAQEAVAQGIDKNLEYTEKAFLYMPYMHSESAVIHEEADRLFKALNKEDNYEFELRHKAIIERFGRYPHRNKVLGRESTQEEKSFLLEVGSSF